jgi:hypothetical protein
VRSGSGGGSGDDVGCVSVRCDALGDESGEDGGVTFPADRLRWSGGGDEDMAIEGIRERVEDAVREARVRHTRLIADAFLIMGSLPCSMFIILNAHFYRPTPSSEFQARHRSCSSNIHALPILELTRRSSWIVKLHINTSLA